MDLTEAEDIKNRWWEYTELCRKDLHDSDNHDGVFTHLESDILECGSTVDCYLNDLDNHDSVITHLESDILECGTIVHLKE